MTRVVPADLDRVRSCIDVVGNGHIHRDVAVGISPERICVHDAVQLDLAGLVRRDMTRGHVHRSARGDAAGTHIERGRIRRDRAHAQG